MCDFRSLITTVNPLRSSGHLRPLTVLAARIVKARPIYVTFLTTPRFIGLVQAELSRSIDPDDITSRDLIRYVSRASVTSCSKLTQ